MRNTILFQFMGHELNNSYIALDSVAALLDVFLMREFNQHCSISSINLPHGGKIIALFVRKVTFQDGKQPRLNLGIKGQEENLTMTKVTVRRFHGALRKAMNWISPWPVVR